MADQRSGVLLVFEGIDGSGKSTQAKLLVGRLRAAGETVVASKEPTDGEWGRKIRATAETGRLSPEDELEAFVKDRREHVDTLIQPALDRGEVVVLDRYFYSTIAYQGARGMDVEMLRQRMEQFPVPDAVYLVDVDPAVGRTRIGSRGDKPNAFEDHDGLATARAIFLSLGDEVIVIDGNQSLSEVHAAIVAHAVAGPLALRPASKALLGLDLGSDSDADAVAD